MKVYVVFWGDSVEGVFASEESANKLRDKLKEEEIGFFWVQEFEVQQ